MGPVGIRSLLLGDDEIELSLRIKKMSLRERIIYDPYPFREIQDDIMRYLDGERRVFDYEVDLNGQSPFTKDILRVVRGIPYGRRTTYKWIATLLKTSPRAVGLAVSKNPVPIIIPCHRVIREDGGLGGYSLGIGIKRRLLYLEGFDD